MKYTAKEFTALINNLLLKRGFNISHVNDKYTEATKKLPRVGLKERVIYFIITYSDKLTLDQIKQINKVFEKRKPKSLRTFYFYNIIVVCEKGYDPNVFSYIRSKMMESWNIRPMFIWDLLSTSYTKITHIIDLSNKSIVYPYTFDELRVFMHKLVRELLNEISDILANL